MEGQPLRVHDEHGMFLSHFSLSRRHSAHAMTPYERFHSRSLYLLELAASPRPESGMAERFRPFRLWSKDTRAGGTLDED